MSLTESDKARPSTKVFAFGPLEAAALQAAAPVVLAVMESDGELRVEVVELFKQLANGDLDFHERQATTALLAEILFSGRANKGAPGSEASEIKELARGNVPKARRIMDRMDREEATFAVRLREIMGRRGITQMELAEKLGIGQPALSMMLQRQCRPQRRTVERLAEALGVAVTDLWRREGPKAEKAT